MKPLLHEASQQKKFDVRIMQRHLISGAVPPSEFEQTQKQLPDDSESAEWISIEKISQDESKGSK